VPLICATLRSMALTDAQKRIYGRRPQPNRALITLRINAGLTPNMLGQRARVAGNTVRAAERGSYIEVPQQEAIAAVLGVEVLDLFPFERQRIAA
jgi:DNA-binding XRE family transcriptional regulator